MALRGQQYRESIRSVVALFDMIREEGLTDGLAALWGPALAKNHLEIDELRDLVSYHLHPIDAAEEDRVVETLIRCARGA